MNKADNQSNAWSPDPTPQSDLKSEPGLWELLGALEDVEMSRDFLDRVTQETQRPTVRFSLLKRVAPIAVAAGLLVLAIWWFSRDPMESLVPEQGHRSVPEITANDIEALLGDSLNEDEYLAKEVDGLSIENREWFGG